MNFWINCLNCLIHWFVNEFRLHLQTAKTLLKCRLFIWMSVDASLRSRRQHFRLCHQTSTRPLHRNQSRCGRRAFIHDNVAPICLQRRQKRSAVAMERRQISKSNKVGCWILGWRWKFNPFVDHLDAFGSRACVVCKFDWSIFSIVWCIKRFVAT